MDDKTPPEPKHEIELPQLEKEVEEVAAKPIEPKRKYRLNFARIAKFIRVWAFNFIVIFLVIVLLKIIVQEIYDRGYHIQAIRVPQELEANGYDGVTAAYMILDDVNKMIAVGNRNRNTSDVEEYKQSSERNQLQVEVAGIGISPETISAYIKQAIGIKSKSISGEVVKQGNTLKLLLRISGNPTETLTQIIDSSGAANAFEKIIQQGAESVLKRNYPLILSSYYVVTGNEKAIDALHYTIQSKPDQAADAYAMMALFTFYNISNRDSTTAMRIIRESLAIDPKNSNAYGAWGIIEDASGNGEKCETLLRRSVELDPTNVNSWSVLGSSFFFAGRNDKAISCFEKCYSLDSTYLYSLAFWADLLFGDGKISEANKKLEKLRYLDSSFGRELSIAIPVALGDTSQAMRNFRENKKFISLNNLANQLNNYAFQYEQRKTYDVAFRLVRFTLKLDSTSSDARFPFSTLAELYGLTGQKEKFYSNLEKSFKLGIGIHLADLVVNEPYKGFSSEERFKKLLVKYKVK